MLVRLAAADLETIRARAKSGEPEEVCGILVGRRGETVLEVERVIPTANAHPNPRTEYLIPPEELLRVCLQAEDEWGLEVVGFYHSHPAGPPHLSRTDVARASWPGAAYLLVWLAPEEGVGVSTWNEASRSFEPLDLEVR